MLISWVIINSKNNKIMTICMFSVGSSSYIVINDACLGLKSDS